MAPEQYLGVLQEASTEGIYAAGHLDVGIAEALAAGIRDIVHVDEFLEYHTAEPLSLTGFRPVSFDYSGIPATVATVRDHDAAVVVNLTTDVNTVRYLEVGPDYFLRPEYSVLRPEYREGLQTGRVVRWTPQEEWRRDHLNPFLFELTRQLHEGGVLLLAGTDASMDNGSLPAHIHDELQLQVAAGLSPFEALRTATVNAQIVAARMGDEDLFGRIAPGYRGDLLLLRMNPLEDIRATTERVGVMTRGSWYPQAELDAMVADFIAGFGEE
jgi:imidazolonepropionase-like amidohydrolase